MLDTSKVKTKMNVAAGVIVKEGENGEQLLLLIQRASDDHWPLHFEFPRGKCDKPKGEDLIKCCKREIKEETGLDVEPIFEIDTFQYIADNGERLSTCHNFYCKMKDPNQKVKLSHEHENYKWIQSVGEVELMVHPDQKKTIEKVFNKHIKMISNPDNDFTKNNVVDEYLNHLQETNPIHRIRAMEKKIKIYKAKMVKKCPKTPDPNLCKQIYQKKIAKQIKYINKLKGLKFSSYDRGINRVKDY